MSKDKLKNYSIHEPKRGILGNIGEAVHVTFRGSYQDRLFRGLHMDLRVGITQGRIDDTILRFQQGGHQWEVVELEGAPFHSKLFRAEDALREAAESRHPEDRNVAIMRLLEISREVPRNV